MREIRFRAWDKEHKKMRAVKELSFEPDGPIHGLLAAGGKGIGRVYLGEPIMVDVGNKNHPEGYLDDYPLMQYTGLKDSYAVEEYFDDIIEEEDGTRRVIEDGSSAVLFKNPQEKYDIKYFWELLGSHKVIGNIYENPELLEK